MATRSDSGYQFEFSGGALCLDFANTLGDRPRCAEEHLGDWSDLLAWAEQAGLVSRRELAQLRQWAAAHPELARPALARATMLRECVYRVFGALAAGRRPAPRDLAALNAGVSATLAHAAVEPTSEGFEWGWEPGPPSFERLLWPVVRSAAELLVSPEHADVRECGSDTCSWLFVDRSRTKRRRWCSMKTCGNRDKVRRFYERQRESATS